MMSSAVLLRAWVDAPDVSAQRAARSGRVFLVVEAGQLRDLPAAIGRHERCAVRHAADHVRGHQLGARGGSALLPCVAPKCDHVLAESAEHREGPVLQQGLQRLGKTGQHIDAALVLVADDELTVLDRLPTIADHLAPALDLAWLGLWRTLQHWVRNVVAKSEMLVANPFGAHQRGSSRVVRQREWSGLAQQAGYLLLELIELLSVNRQPNMALFPSDERMRVSQDAGAGGHALSKCFERASKLGRYGRLEQAQALRAQRYVQRRRRRIALTPVGRCRRKAAQKRAPLLDARRVDRTEEVRHVGKLLVAVEDPALDVLQVSFTNHKSSLVGGTLLQWVCTTRSRATAKRASTRAS